MDLTITLGVNGCNRHILNVLSIVEYKFFSSHTEFSARYIILNHRTILDKFKKNKIISTYSWHNIIKVSICGELVLL